MSAADKSATPAVVGVPRQHTKLIRAIERVLVEYEQLQGSRGIPLPADNRFGAWACSQSTHVEVKTSSRAAAEFVQRWYRETHKVELTLSTKRFGHKYILTLTPRS